MLVIDDFVLYILANVIVYCITSYLDKRWKQRTSKSS